MSDSRGESQDIPNFYKSRIKHVPGYVEMDLNRAISGYFHDQ